MPACHAGDRRFESGRVRQILPLRGGPHIRPLSRSLVAVLLTVGLLAAACGSNAPVVTAPPSTTPTPGLPTAIPATQAPTGPPVSPLAPTPEAPPSTDSPQPSATPTPPAPQAVELPFVPVVSFWSTRTSISMHDLRTALTGGDVAIAADDAQAVGAAIGAEVPASFDSAGAVKAAVRDARLGVLRVTDVDQSVRALAIDGVSLFGNDRIDDVSRWPLTATVESSETWDQSRTWTLVAGGDIMLDRGVAHQTTILGKGRDYLFDGGTARVVRVRCCSFFGYEYPIVERTGNRGLMREFLTSADITMANLETAVLENAPYHESGFTFTADASLLPALADAGIDFLSLANNHSRDAGERGILTAIEHLDALGVANAGAGRGTASDEPALLEANGTTVAVIACNGVRGGTSGNPTVNPDRVRSMNCNDDSVARAIRAIRDSADVVIVFPHWGVEYYPRPRDHQRRTAAEWIGAGADMIIGAHSHFPGGIEDIDGRLVFYSLGNFIFDQDFRQATMMGLLPEMTFHGAELVQVRLHTTLIVEAQPNFADPETDGQFAYDLVRQGSRGLLDY